ncbi:MAG: hypothetical protein JXA46_05360 [Dehalococcoidales bacterium]|nr:hypothetical protein [Dehalococcoidales bacterium]
MAESILSYLWQAFSTTLIQILILFGPGLVLTLLLNFETIFIQSRAVNIMGRGWYLGLFGGLGTIVHELGHAVFCPIFLHKITDMRLFQPDSSTGTLGYVKHSYNRANIYQSAGNFFIGIGPILLGTAVIFLLSGWLLGINVLGAPDYLYSTTFPLNTWAGFTESVQNLLGASYRLFAEIFSPQHLTSWHLYVFIYLAFAIGSSITLSPPDIKAALGGFAVIAILILILNLFTVRTLNLVYNIITAMSGYYVLFYTMLILVLLLNIAAALLVLLPISLLRSGHSRAN